MWRLRFRLDRRDGGGAKDRASGAEGGPVGILRQRDFALAAVAASQALLAEVIVAGVLGAPRTDPSRFLAADATDEGHGLFLSAGRQLRQHAATTLRLAIHHLIFL